MLSFFLWKVCTCFFQEENFLLTKKAGYAILNGYLPVFVARMFF